LIWALLWQGTVCPGISGSSRIPDVSKGKKQEG
jgi:hypothetical protein